MRTLTEKNTEPKYGSDAGANNVTFLWDVAKSWCGSPGLPGSNLAYGYPDTEQQQKIKLENVLGRHE